MEQPPTRKDPFLVSMDQNLVLECTSDDNYASEKDYHASEDQEHVTKRRQHFLLMRRLANFGPKPHNFTKNGQKNTAEHSTTHEQHSALMNKEQRSDWL